MDYIEVSSYGHSHIFYKNYKRCLEKSKYNSIAILEDDIYFHKDFNNMIEKYPRHYLILYG